MFIAEWDQPAAVDLRVGRPPAELRYPDTPSNPTTAHQRTLALLHTVLLQAASRRQDELPGLVETLQDDVVMTTGGTTQRALGWFAEEAWRYGDRQVHELFLNADRRNPHTGISAAEDVLTTLLHEDCHVRAHAQGIKDTSRDGRYHNRKFAEIALSIGLTIERDTVIGHRTPSLSSSGRADYADLLRELEYGLVLAREPQPTERQGDDTESGDQQTAIPSPDGPQSSSSKYVFASCRCQNGRHRPVTIRVARGSWKPGVIRCSVCDAPFAES